MQYTKEQKREAYKKLPPEMQEAIVSVETPDKIKAVAEKNGLKYDQMSELSDEIGLLMFGLTSSNDFVNNISARLQIDSQKAHSVAEDVNREIFDSVRDSMKNIQARETQDDDVSENGPISDLEVVPEPPIEPEIDRGPINRDEILNGIENPQMASTRPINVLEQSHKNGDDMVDHMLTGTVSQPIITETRKEKYSTDPYREPIN